LTESKLVYSTEHGRICPHCEKPSAQCICKKKKDRPPENTDGRIRVSRETKGKKGKGVTCITGLPLGTSELRELTKKLKRRLGAGGTVRGGNIEIQGDHRDTLVEELIKLGFKAKRSGG